MTVTEITASDAKAHGLPAFYFKVDTNGTTLTTTPFPEPGKYLIASGPPGGPLLAIVWAVEGTAADLDAVERAIRLRFAEAWQQPLAIHQPGTVTIAGEDRPALAFSTGQGMRRTGWAGVIVSGSDGAVLVTLGRGIANAAPACAEIVAEPSLAAFARSFALRERRMPAPSAVQIRGWSAALRENAVPQRAMGALLGLAAGQVTDDLQLAAVIAAQFLASDHVIAAELASGYLARRAAAFDVGAESSQALDQIGAGMPADKAGRAVWESYDRFPAGNGSLKRTAVLGVLLAGMDVETRRRATFIDSTITHFDPRCVLACATFNAAIAHALTERPSPSSMVRAARDELAPAAAQLRLHYGEVAPEIEAARAALARDLDAAHDDDPQLYLDELQRYGRADFVRVAFRLAFWELVHAPDYPSGVVDAANRGGDAGANAAIVGALLGAFHGVDGIPQDWRTRVLGATAANREPFPHVFLRALERAYGGA